MSFGARAIRAAAVRSSGAAVSCSRLSMSSRTVMAAASRTASYGLAARLPASASMFSTSIRRMDVTGELVSKIESEIEFEVTASGERDSGSYEDHFRAIGFEIEDVAGQEEVVLTREYNGESIKITFSVSDIHNAETGNPFSDEADQTLFDEGFQSSKQTETSEQTGKKQAAAQEQGELAEDALENVSFICRVNIEVKKPGQEATLHFSALAEDGEFIVESMPFYPTGQVPPAEEDQQYIGPPFSNLDADLQMLVSRYLEERGINTDLALLIPEYVDWKEQKEYIRWLRNIKDFVSA